MSKIYTRTGDKGLTGLMGGARVPKNHARVEAYGTVDEANAALGLLISNLTDVTLRRALQDVQRMLLFIGAALANTSGQHDRPAQTDIDRLEQHIDDLSAYLPPLASFILPGGSESAALAHLARTTVRRAERRVVTLSQHQTVPLYTVPYLNRLSDYLFMVARVINFDLGVTEQPWPGSRNSIGDPS